MILLLGATGFYGQAFARELRRRGRCFIPLTRSALDYTRFDLLFDYVRKMKPVFLINAAGTSGIVSDHSSELTHRATLEANTVLPQTIARVCAVTNTPWGHVSSGSIYAGAKVFGNGEMRIEKDLHRPELRKIFEIHRENILGFTESDEPNFSFRHQPCSFFSGTKALAEEALSECKQTYIWRFHLAFNQHDDPCNWLSTIQRTTRLTDGINSLSHLEDCVRACLELWDRGTQYGIYNVTNPGAITTRQVIEMINRILKPDRRLQNWTDEAGFDHADEKAFESNCILDVSKLLRTGIKMRTVKEALENSLELWQPVVRPDESVSERLDARLLVGSIAYP